MTQEVTILQKATENAEFWSKRTSDFRHLGLWPSECDSTSELVIQPNQSNGDEDNLNAETKASAVASIRTLNTAQISYNSAYPTMGFGGSLGVLAGTSCAPPTSAGACLIDTQLASGTKSGYTFAMVGVTGTPASTYQAVASPIAANTTGVRSFCSVADAVVRYSAAALTACAGTETPLQ